MPRMAVAAGAAALREFSTVDLSQPLEEVRSFLVARYQQRNELHPRLLEETVASVYDDLGYFVQVTAYSRDGGIDVILRKNDEQVGVQVKRTRNGISAEQLRALVGALFLGGYTRGVFVTTSSFEKGAKVAADVATFRGIPIELVDSKRFYDLLSITQKDPYLSFDAWHDDFAHFDFHGAVIEPTRPLTGTAIRPTIETDIIWEKVRNELLR